LQELPANDPHRHEYLVTFQNMAAALKKVQRPDGFWNVSLADPNDFAGPEASGTAFFTYGMAWGINNGYLDGATYRPVVAKAWNGMVTAAVHPDGFLGYIQGVGREPASSQPVTYDTTSDFGVGAFLLAGSELSKLSK
jgi:rhamnogalacturonyl hydrolase YesR